jgi:hypothetical protein
MLAPVIPARIADFMDVKRQGVEDASPFKLRDPLHGTSIQTKKRVGGLNAAQFGVNMENYSSNSMNWDKCDAAGTP